MKRFQHRLHSTPIKKQQIIVDCLFEHNLKPREKKAAPKTNLNNKIKQSKQRSQSAVKKDKNTSKTKVHSKYSSNHKAEHTSRKGINLKTQKNKELSARTALTVKAVKQPINNFIQKITKSFNKQQQSSVIKNVKQQNTPPPKQKKGKEYQSQNHVDQNAFKKINIFDNLNQLSKLVQSTVDNITKNQRTPQINQLFFSKGQESQVKNYFSQNFSNRPVYFQVTKSQNNDFQEKQIAKTIQNNIFIDGQKQQIEYLQAYNKALIKISQYQSQINNYKKQKQQLQTQIISKNLIIQQIKLISSKQQQKSKCQINKLQQMLLKLKQTQINLQKSLKKQREDKIRIKEQSIQLMKMLRAQFQQQYE